MISSNFNGRLDWQRFNLLPFTRCQVWNDLKKKVWNDLAGLESHILPLRFNVAFVFHLHNKGREKAFLSNGIQGLWVCFNVRTSFLLKIITAQSCLILNLLLTKMIVFLFGKIVQIIVLLIIVMVVLHGRLSNTVHTLNSEERRVVYKIKLNLNIVWKKKFF